MLLISVIMFGARALGARGPKFHIITKNNYFIFLGIRY